jgi:hypothetical protein
MTKKYFWAIAGKFHVPPETKKLMDTDELFEGKPKEMKLLYENNFETDTGTSCALPPLEGKKSVCVEKTHPYTPLYSIPASSVNGKWIRAQATLFYQVKQWNVWEIPQFLVRFTNKGQKIKETFIRVGRLMNDGDIKDIYIDAKIPSTTFDTVSVFFAGLNSSEALEIDNLKVWSFNE